MYGTENSYVHVHMHSWGNLWTRYKKIKNLAATFEEPGEKAGYYAGTLHTAPPKEWANNHSHPLGLTLGPHPPLA